VAVHKDLCLDFGKGRWNTHRYIAVLYLMRIRIEQWIIDEAAKIAWDWGPLSVVLLVLLVGAESTHSVIKEDRNKYSKKLYEINPEARIARAHIVFYDLWRSAHENGHRWTLEQKQSWDESIRDDLNIYCKEEALNTYVGNTRPSGEDLLTGISPLQENAFAKAITDIKLLLDGRLKIFIK